MIWFHTMRRISFLLLLAPILVPRPVGAWQNLIPKNLFGGVAIPIGTVLPFASTNAASQKARETEDRLISAVKSVNRLDQSIEIDELVAQLEDYSMQAVPPSIAEPAIAPEIYGKWRLLYTTNTATSSPIQRSAVNAASFPIYQNIEVRSSNDQSQLIVSQVVQFNPQSKLRVDALASTIVYPLLELTERKSATTFGLSLFGTSLVGDEALPDPRRPNSRIDFVFDEGSFDLNDGQLKIPYPVPFRLPILRDTVKGWIDITWLSDRLRISRGNKGSTFILIKEE